MTDVIHWTVPQDHPTFAGHFPGTPILPGVVLLDIVLHAVSIGTGILLDACEISTVKFLSPASPGDQLVIQHARAADNAIRFDVAAGVRKIASGTIVCGSQP
jgi:3-hydroxyacyl-[acyl-carrier-protein] dehydratase